jgi:D-tyrosyl-tRNA(Tyr) deacylase
VRAVVQRVKSARVTVARETVAEMDDGLLALVGIGLNDDAACADQLAHKLVHLRIFADDAGRMNRSLIETDGTLGIVSQFTLWGDIRKGRRPYFGDAAAPEVAEPLVESVVESARKLGVRVVAGRFGAAMEVTLVNDGPVTLMIDTERDV